MVRVTVPRLPLPAERMAAAKEVLGRPALDPGDCDGYLQRHDRDEAPPALLRILERLIEVDYWRLSAAVSTGR
jgi:hypothetical protein